MWLSETSATYGEVVKSGQQTYYRWDDYLFDGAVLTRFLTIHTDEEVVATVHEAEAIGGMRAKMMSQTVGNFRFDDRFRQLVTGTTRKLLSHKHGVDEQAIFDALPESAKESLETMKMFKAAELIANRAIAGHDLFAPSEEEKLEMSIYETVKATAGAEDKAAAFLSSMSSQRHQTTTKAPSKKRRQRDAKKAATANKAGVR
jgi:hypothetical protein